MRVYLPVCPHKLRVYHSKLGVYQHKLRVYQGKLKASRWHLPFLSCTNPESCRHKKKTPPGDSGGASNCRLSFQAFQQPLQHDGGRYLAVGRLRDDDGAVLFSGDTLFAGCIGRTDFWGGSHTVLLDSIRTRILTLDDEVVVCPGHEETSTVGVERRTNPYIMQ